MFEIRHNFGAEYQKDCDNIMIRSNFHDMYLQKLRKIALSTFDDERFYFNENERYLGIDNKSSQKEVLY